MHLQTLVKTGASVVAKRRLRVVARLEFTCARPRPFAQGQRRPRTQTSVLLASSRRCLAAQRREISPAAVVDSSLDRLDAARDARAGAVRDALAPSADGVDVELERGAARAAAVERTGAVRRASACAADSATEPVRVAFDPTGGDVAVAAAFDLAALGPRAVGRAVPVAERVELDSWVRRAMIRRDEVIILQPTLCARPARPTAAHFSPAAHGRLSCVKRACTQGLTAQIRIDGNGRRARRPEC